MKRKLLFALVSLLVLQTAYFSQAIAAAKRVRVGYLPVTGHAKFFVAQEKGFFREEGIDVELIEFQNSADGISAVRAGKLDVGAFGTTAPLVHISRGADLQVIGGVMGEDAAIVVTAANAGRVKRVTDLKGKKVATVRLASGDAVLRGALSRAGIDWQRDLEIFELKNPPAVIEAVKSGQVDAGVVWGPHDLRAEEQGLKVVLRSGELSPGHPCCRLAANRKTVTDQPRVWVGFLRAILKAEKFAKENRPETVAIIVKYLKLDPTLVEQAYYSPHLDQSSDPNVKGVEHFWSTMQKSGFIESQEQIKPHINTDLYRQALDSLVREQPKEPYWQQLQKTFSQRNRS
jgi:NitT/TauT family transport system substrate-binding protein